MTIYGLKGMAAYAEHALNLGHKDPDIHAFMEEALYQVSRNDIAADELVAWYSKPVRRVSKPWHCSTRPILLHTAIPK